MDRIPILMVLWLVLVSVSLAACLRSTVFRSLDTDAHGDPQRLTGALVKPMGDGPFPAVVLMHGCAGIKHFHNEWTNRLQRWGYVSLLVDSFRPRGRSNLCSPGQGYAIQPARRAKDAFGAKRYLESLPYVDPDRIAVMGWSHGGMAVLEAVQIHVPSSRPFQAGIAYYPYCTRLYILNTPLLVLIGEKDDWTPAVECRAQIQPRNGWPRIVLRVYPGAYHAFDQPFDLNWYMGHRVGRHQQSALTSYQEVRTFLETHLTSDHRHAD